MLKKIFLLIIALTIFLFLVKNVSLAGEKNCTDPSKDNPKLCYGAYESSKCCIGYSCVMNSDGIVGSCVKDAQINPQTGGKNCIDPGGICKKGGNPCCNDPQTPNKYQCMTNTLDITGSTICTTPDPNVDTLIDVNKQKKPNTPPCKPNLDPSGGTNTYYTCDTGFGFPIDTRPVDFVKAMFQIILSISGGIALLLVIFSGYRMVMSQGNPEKIQEARDRLTSAIVGLLFIIFSLVILQIIGVDILKIPQFMP